MKVAVLGFIACILLAGISCSNNRTMDEKAIEATVEARVEARVASLPTMTPYPTYTPAPLPTQTPKPTHTPKPPPTVTPIPLPPPVIFAPFKTENGISHNSIGTPVIKLCYLNVSEKILDAIEFRICPKNRFGETLKEYGHGDNCFIGVTDEVIIPFVNATNSKATRMKREKGELSDYLPLTSENYTKLIYDTSEFPGMWEGWTMHGFDTAVEVDIELVRVHFQDGTVWTENGN